MIQLDGKAWHNWNPPVFQNGTVSSVKLFAERVDIAYRCRCALCQIERTSRAPSEFRRSRIA